MPTLCRLLVAAVALWSGCGSAAHAAPLRIGYLVWVGNGPLFVAQEKGFFAKEGIEVGLIDMAVGAREMPAAAPSCAGKADPPARAHGQEFVEEPARDAVALGR